MAPSPPARGRRAPGERARSWATPALAALAVALAVLVALATTGNAYDAVRAECAVDLCDPFERPTPQTLTALDRVGATAEGYAVAVVVLQWAMLLTFAGLGLLLLRRRPSVLSVATAVGLLTLALLPFADQLGEAGWERGVRLLITLASQVSLFLVLALFPDGRWHPRFLRAWAPVLAVAFCLVPAARALGVDVGTTAELLDSVPMLLLVAAQVHRYARRSDWLARQQTKWVLSGFVLLALNLLLAFLLQALDRIAGLQLLVVSVAYVSFTLVGLGVTFAVLRYRLYDVGLVLWRTTVYGAGVLGILAAYFLLVALASMPLARQSASVLAIAAVAVAVLGGAWLSGRLKGSLQRRLYGTGDVAAALAGTIHDGGGLAQTLARALALPHVEVRTADGTVVSSEGTPPATGVVREQVSDADGELLGELVLAPAYGDQLDRRDQRALSEVLPFVALVLRAQRENQALRSARAAAARSREDERRRLRRELHDGVGPLLATQLISLDTLKVAQERGTPPDGLYDDMERQTRAAIAEIRSITHDLRPPALDAGGLRAALRQEVERVGAAGVAVDLHVEVGELPAAVEVGTLRIVQEALTNVVRHARTSRACVRVVATDEVEILVEDEGIGGVQERGGLGTASMRERAEELGGTLTISNRDPERGVRVHGRIPL